MTVADLIKRLEEFDGRLLVCLADWQEEHGKPSAEAAEDIALVQNGKYFSSTGLAVGDFVCIG